MNSYEIKTKWIIYAVIIFLSLAGGRCNNEATDNCKLATLEQFDEYHNIAVEITDISCPLSKSSHFKATPTASLVSRNFEEVVQSFNATCRRYIDALSFKYQLQEVLFSSNRMLSSNTLALQITSLIINLQTAAMKLQDIQLELNEEYCVTFTSEQYKSIYFSRLHKEDILSSLCERARIWQDKNYVCARWRKYM